VDKPVDNYIKPAYQPVDKPLFSIKPGYPNLWLWGYLDIWHRGYLAIRFVILLGVMVILDFPRKIGYT
jgi:hypothetical protein